jgi:hypothetical protein
VTGTISSPPIYQVSLQGSDANGLPDGTVLGSGTPASATFDPSAWSAFSFNWIELDNPYTPTVGQIVMPVLEYSSGTISSSNRIGVVSSWNMFINSTRFGSRYTTNNWSTATRSQPPGLALRTAGSRIGVVSVGNAPTTASIGTVGNREAAKFTLPEFFSSLTCYGLRMACKPTSNSTIKLGLWDAAGVEIQAETISELTLSSSSTSYMNCVFATPATILPNTTYYAGIERTGSSCDLMHVELSEANDQLAYPLGTAACRATWNGSAWTDNTTFRPLSLELLISDITGGGGASFPLIGGGGLIY